MKKLLKKIHDSHGEYIESIGQLEEELTPYLEDYFHGEPVQILIAVDEGKGLFLVNPINNVRYPLNEDHIEYIKKNKGLIEKLGCY